MIPEHDHERDDDLRPDPFIDVSWSGRIKKKRRRRSDPESQANWISPTPQEDGQHDANAPRQTAPTQPRRSIASQLRPRKKRNPLPFTLIIFVITFILLRGASGITGLVTDTFKKAATPTWTPTQEARDVRMIAPGEPVTDNGFEITIDNFNRDIDAYFEEPAMPEFYADAEYIAFEITVRNLKGFKSHFYYQTGWSSGDQFEWAQTTNGCPREAKENSDVG